MAHTTPSLSPGRTDPSPPPSLALDAMTSACDRTCRGRRPDLSSAMAGSRVFSATICSCSSRVSRVMGGEDQTCDRASSMVMPRRCLTAWRRPASATVHFGRRRLMGRWCMWDRRRIADSGCWWLDRTGAEVATEYEGRGVRGSRSRRLMPRAWRFLPRRARAATCGYFVARARVDVSRLDLEVDFAAGVESGMPAHRVSIRSARRAVACSSARLMAPTKNGV